MESSCELQQTVVRRESQEQREKTTKSREKPRLEESRRPVESRPAEPREEKPSREEPTPEVQRQEEQNKKERTEQEQLELEQLMEWSSEGENDTATREKSISATSLLNFTMVVFSPWTTDENKFKRSTIRYKGVYATT